MLKIAIKTGGSAFEPKPEYELARLLRKCAQYLEAMEDFDEKSYSTNILDINGNRVGTMEVKR